jgi:hypothetical protein
MRHQHDLNLNVFIEFGPFDRETTLPLSDGLYQMERKEVVLDEKEPWDD